MNYWKTISPRRVVDLRNRADIVSRWADQQDRRSQFRRVSSHLCHAMLLALDRIYPTISPEHANWALEGLLLDGWGLWYLTRQQR